MAKRATKKEKSAAVISTIVDIAVKAIQEKKGKNIVTLDLRNVKNAVTDYYIVCHGDSNTQVNALARSVEDEVFKALGEDPFHKEGFENAEWVLLDYFNVVVHVFNQEKRDFFGLERLWADAEIKEYS
jgi:ribosome-associated protein